MKELEINDTPYGLRVMATDHPTNKSVGSCPKDISTKMLKELGGATQVNLDGRQP